MKILEMIVVEGSHDTVAIRRAVEADTIETGGSALNESVYQQIELAMQQRGVIIFTDPDHAGERIRRLVARRVPGCKHAFIDAEQGMKKGKVGVEHATSATIRAALATVWTEDITNHQAQFSIMDLIQGRLVNTPNSYERRLQLGKLLRIGYANGKTLLKRLNMFHITRAQFNEALLHMEGNDD
jgi:ribonuclease M5